MGEIWRPIEDYEGIYLVSNLGRVKSVDREIMEKTGKRRPIKGRILKPYIDKAGYKTCRLYKDGIDEFFFIHRLVSMAFVDKNEGKDYINHIDGDKGNNNAKNLEWCTHQENIVHAFETGLSQRGSRHYRTNLTERDVLEIRKLYKKGKYYQYELAEKFDIDPSQISRIINESAWGWLKTDSQKEANIQ